MRHNVPVGNEMLKSESTSDSQRRHADNDAGDCSSHPRVRHAIAVRCPHTRALNIDAHSIAAVTPAQLRAMQAFVHNA